MKKTIVSMIMFLPLLAMAQGIKWADDLTWEQVKRKAKTENKYIFIDVYATWCGPCKQMDKDIYPLTNVGKLYNEKFISIRVQADQTEKDDAAIKSWYTDARNICQTYNANAYPTFLFLSPDAKLTHRASGALHEEKFIELAKDAFRDKGYVLLIERFTKSDYENLDLKELAMSAKYAGDDSLATAIATKYVEKTEIQELIKQDNMFFVYSFGVDNKKWITEVCMPKIKDVPKGAWANPAAIRFLLHAIRNDTLVSKATDLWISRMNDKELFTKDTLEWIKQFMQDTTDKSFGLLYKNSVRIDKIMNKRNWAQHDIDMIIIKDEFYEPIFNPAAQLIQGGIDGLSLINPDWNKVKKSLTQKYGAACARRLQFSPKMDWYNLVGNKKEYIKNLVAEMDRTNGWELNGIVLNNTSMDVFRYSTSRKELEIAANWMKKYFKKNPEEMKTDYNGLDTYAILLYKAGKITASIEIEEKAFAMNSSNVEIAGNLSNMKKGLPIWPKGYDVRIQ